MKVKKTIIIDTKWIEIGDTFYKFPTYDENNPKAFYEWQKLVISDIRIAPKTDEVIVCWNKPVQNGTLPESHRILDFKWIVGKNEKWEGEIFNFTHFLTTGMAWNPSFNFYVIDKKWQVQKEIEKRKEYVINKLKKEISDSEERIKKNQEIIDSLK